MGDTDVELAVRWNGSGQDVPARTAAGLHSIKVPDGEAAPRLEARAPTMVLRRARGAVEELTASAIGSTGPIGRLGASVAMLGGASAPAAAFARSLSVRGKALVTEHGLGPDVFECINVEITPEQLEQTKRAAATISVTADLRERIDTWVKRTKEGGN